uniref:Ribosomal protein S3 n=1 Tax=Ichthyophthirius multifiliis TaxID=5932 RepID=G1FLB2_ICHMU|nr:ribosomal protein S3 [Ichthyophthirius multifiliis]AEL89254.1 ribosomal protein S3 [Ichthyophthirius multifiliis]
MGLKSLPILNKCGISMYWYNIWDSLKLYKKYNNSYNLLSNLIYYFLTENLYYICLFKNIKSFKSTIRFKKIDVTTKNNKYIHKKFLKKLFIGRIVFLSFQTWTIISIKYTTTNMKYINYKTNLNLSRRLIFKYYLYNINNMNILKNNYKYKFNNRKYSI